MATAIYSGADAVMLSAESASGQFPLEALSIMDSIIKEIENDPSWRTILEANHSTAEASTATVAMAKNSSTCGPPTRSRRTSE